MLHKNWHLGTWTSLFCLEHNKQNISNIQGAINEFSWVCVDQSSGDLGTCLTKCIQDFWTCLTILLWTFGPVWPMYWERQYEGQPLLALHESLQGRRPSYPSRAYHGTRSQWDSKLANSEEMMGAWEDRSKTDLLSSSAGRGTGEGGRTSLNVSFR